MTTWPCVIVDFAATMSTAAQVTDGLVRPLLYYRPDDLVTPDKAGMSPSIELHVLMSLVLFLAS